MEKALTGFASIDKPWLKYYKKGGFEKALNTPEDISLFRFYMQNVFTNPDFPILKYFNATITTRDFIALIELWAKAFCAVGVAEDEMVPVYGTWSPEIAAVFFALNAIGAHPYFEKLDITESALRTETAGAKIGVIFEPLWNKPAKAVFCEERFEKVFVVCLADSMRFPLKQIVGLKSLRFKKGFTGSKYIFKDQVEKLASGYTHAFEKPFKKNRLAIITSSSGTTSSVVKGIMDTNESALANVLGSSYSESGLFPGKESLITLPPTASTAINSFFLLPLCMGMTVRLDPRADEKSWTRLLLKYKPSLALNTGSLWYSFYRNVDRMCKQGKKIDLSHADMYTMGGSGVTLEQLDFMNRVAKKCHAPHPVVSGYGCSEFFGVITVDKYDVIEHPNTVGVIDVGIPMLGAVLSIFDEDGNELPYGQRGEIRVNGPSKMHGYFGKPELSSEMFDGVWLKTGDIGEMDKDGYVYCYGRKSASIQVNGKIIYLFDIANDLRKQFDLEDCMVEAKELITGIKSVVVYFVQKTKPTINVKEICIKMNAYLAKMGIVIDGYRNFDEAFPISPTTLKPLTRYTDGFINYNSAGDIISIGYWPTETDDVWKMHTSSPS